ncbi:hypothetical protein Q6249_29620, partial [Klebsiella pneumoniae]|nr:hypothetical protein [Klebsiella pneumoniae]
EVVNQVCFKVIGNDTNVVDNPMAIILNLCVDTLQHLIEVIKQLPRLIKVEIFASLAAAAALHLFCQGNSGKNPDPAML